MCLTDRMAHDFCDLPSPCTVAQVVEYLRRYDAEGSSGPVYAVYAKRGRV